MTDGSGRPAAFIDRDGTIIVEREYLSDPRGVELIPGAARALRTLAEAGYAIVITTNQSGIGRGYYTEADYRAVRDRVDTLLSAVDVPVLATYHCPHHPDFSGPCDCRKPEPGLFLLAAREHGLDLARSVFIGDRMRDVEPGLELGGRAILVRTGHGLDEELRQGDHRSRDVLVADDLASAVRLLIPHPPTR